MPFAMTTKPFVLPKEEPMRRPRSFSKSTGSEQALKGRCRNWTERLGSSTYESGGWQRLVSALP